MIIDTLGRRIAVLCATTLLSACSSSSAPAGGGAPEAGAGTGGAATGGSTSSSSGGSTSGSGGATSSGGTGGGTASGGAATGAGGSTTGTGGATSSGGTTGSGGSQADAGSACNTVSNAGPAVPKTANAGAFTDTLTGGTFADGTYQLTAWTEYGTSSAGSTTNRETYVISGDVMQGVTTPNGVGQPELHFTATLTTSGSNLVTLDLTCPQVVSLTGTQYQITATGYETYDPKHNRLTVYTRLN